MSLTVAQIIKNVQKAHPKKWEGPQIATTLAFLCVSPSSPLAVLNPSRVTVGIHCPWHRPSADRLDHRIHPRPCCQRLHDRFSYYYRRQPGSLHSPFITSHSPHRLT